MATIETDKHIEPFGDPSNYDGWMPQMPSWSTYRQLTLCGDAEQTLQQAMSGLGVNAEPGGSDCRPGQSKSVVAALHFQPTVVIRRDKFVCLLASRHDPLDDANDLNDGSSKELHESVFEEEVPQEKSIYDRENEVDETESPAVAELRRESLTYFNCGIWSIFEKLGVWGRRDLLPGVWIHCGSGILHDTAVGSTDRVDRHPSVYRASLDLEECQETAWIHDSLSRTTIGFVWVASRELSTIQGILRALSELSSPRFLDSPVAWMAMLMDVLLSNVDGITRIRASAGAGTRRRHPQPRSLPTRNLPPASHARSLAHSPQLSPRRARHPNTLGKRNGPPPD